MQHQLGQHSGSGITTGSAKRLDAVPQRVTHRGVDYENSARPSGVKRQSAMWNPFANMGTLAGNAITIVRGHGAAVFDTTGKRYLDALASRWYCNVGHGRAELADVAATQMRQLATYQAFEAYSNLPAEALAERIADLAPLPDAKVLFTPGGGSDAIDTAAKLAR